MGEIIAYVVVYQSFYEGNASQETVFYYLTGGVFVVGLILICIMVKDLSIWRNYVRDKDGNITRHRGQVHDSNEPADRGCEVPPGAEFIKGASLSACGKIKMVVRQTMGVLCCGDFMLWLALCATFVNQMMAAKAGCLIFLWTVQWVIPDGQVKRSDGDLFREESWDLYSEFKLIAFICAFVLIPLFGYLADKIDLGIELMLTFGLRALAAFAFFVMDNPHGRLVTFTLVIM